MNTIQIHCRGFEFNRARTLAMLDEIEKLPEPDAALAFRLGPGRAHIGWQLMHIGITEEIFATERLAPEKAAQVDRIVAPIPWRQQAGRRHPAAGNNPPDPGRVARAASRDAVDVWRRALGRNPASLGAAQADLPRRAAHSQLARGPSPRPGPRRTQHISGKSLLESANLVETAQSSPSTIAGREPAFALTEPRQRK